jgi:hypothetical protein
LDVKIDKGREEKISNVRPDLETFGESRLKLAVPLSFERMHSSLDSL